MSKRKAETKPMEGPRDPNEPRADEPAYWTDDAWSISSHFQHTGSGRPAKLADAGLVARILAHVAGGASYSGAAQLEGISPTNFSNWQDRGMGPNADAGYAEFVNVLAKAEAHFKRWHERNIVHFAQDDWVPSAWILERRYPGEYGRRSQVDMTHTTLRPGQRPTPTMIPFKALDAQRLALMLEDGEDDSPPTDQPIDGEYREVGPLTQQGPQGD